MLADEPSGGSRAEDTSDQRIDQIQNFDRLGLIKGVKLSVKDIALASLGGVASNFAEIGGVLDVGHE